MLRKIIRRAIRHGRLLGQTQPFLYKMVEAVVKEMIGAYPELGESAARVAKVIESEETRLPRAWRRPEACRTDRSGGGLDSAMRREAARDPVKLANRTIG